MNADGTSQTGITNNAAFDGQPAWSPDAAKFAFASNRDGNFEIYSMNADGSNQTRLSISNGNDAQPFFSPDGTKVSFYSDRDGNLELYTMNADGTLSTRLSFNSVDDIYPKWAPLVAAVTPVGANVNTQSGDAGLTFSNVTTPGTTSNAPVPPANIGNLPGGFAFSDFSQSYQVTTTATFSGPITICYNVPGVNDPALFGALRILHGENGSLIDRTILAPDSPAPDFATRTICARVSSLSPFVVAVAVPNASKPGDFDGDGQTDLATWQPISGNWVVANSSNSTQTTQQWGSQTIGDKIVPGDYDGDGRTDIAV